RFVSRRVLAVKRGLPVRLQHAQRRTDAQRIGGDGARARPLGPFARRRRTPVATSRRAAWREQSRSDAADLQGCPRALPLLVESAARTQGRAVARALLPSDIWRGRSGRARER